MILAIDTADETKKVALFWPKKINDKLEWKDNQIDLIEKVNELLKKNNKNLAQIKYIAVNRGPGSFTGIRQGITLANTLRYVNKVPTLGVKNREKLDILTLAKLAYKNLNTASNIKIVVPFYGKAPNISKRKGFSKKDFSGKMKKR